MKTNGHLVDHPIFVKTFLACATLPEIAAKLGITKHSVMVRANRLRKKGVKLPRKGPSLGAVDVQGLNALIGKYGKGK